MLIIIAYFILRNAIDEPERRSVYAAVVSIVAFIDVPICFMVTRVIPSSIHPVVVREGGMSADMGITLAVCMAGIMLLGFALYRSRFRQVRLTERVEALKEQLEDRMSEGSGCGRRAAHDAARLQRHCEPPPGCPQRGGTAWSPAAGKA